MFEIIMELVVGVITEGSPRALVASSAFASLVLGSALWMFQRAVAPFGALDAVVVGAILLGAAGLMLALLHVSRNSDDRVFGVTGAVLSLSGPAIALWSLLVR